MTQETPEDQERGDCAETPVSSEVACKFARAGASDMLTEITRLFREKTPPDSAEGVYIAGVLADAKRRGPEIADKAARFYLEMLG